MPDLPITYAEPGTVGLGGGGIGARALVKTETVGVRLFSNQRGYSSAVEAIPIPAPSRTASSVRRSYRIPECTLRPAVSGCLSLRRD